MFWKATKPTTVVAIHPWDAERERADLRANVRSLRAAVATLAQAVEQFATAHDADNAAATALADTARAVVRHCDEVIR